MKNLLILSFITCLSLSAETISITSDHARGQRSSTGYFFTYQDKVTAHGPQLGLLCADLLTAHFVQRSTTACDYLLARKVTLRHKEVILSADSAVFNPKTNRLTAQGGVTLSSVIPAKAGTHTTAETAVLDLNTNQLHLDHGTHTHAFTSTGS